MGLTKWQPPSLRHEVDDEGRVTWLELFFDLVYVAALIQLGDRLSEDVSWKGGAAFVGAFVILWWTWTGTTAFTNRFAVDDITHRILAFLQMFAVGNLAILAATNPNNWQMWLAVAYVAARLPLLAMYVRARYSVPSTQPMTDHFLRFFGASAALWVVSIAVPGRARYLVWTIALILEFCAPAILLLRSNNRDEGDLGETRTYAVYTEHFQERYALFTIIVLGETFVKALSQISKLGISTTTQVFGGMAFLILIALWWTYFDDVADAHIRSTGDARSQATNQLIWVYTHLPLAAGLTAFGVVTKKIVSVEAFTDSFKGSYTWLLAVALITTLVAVAVLDMVTVSPHFAIGAPNRIGPRLVAAVLLVPVAALIIQGTLNATVGLGLVTAIVIAQIAIEVVLAHRSEHRLGRNVQAQIAGLAGTCEHLPAAAAPAASPTRACKLCAEKGLDAVQLRWCLTCGHVGCCDDSPGLHATKHYRETGHPVMASIEPGATWAYCYVHEVTDPDWFSADREAPPLV